MNYLSSGSVRSCFLLISVFGPILVKRVVGVAFRSIVGSILSPEKSTPIVIAVELLTLQNSLSQVWVTDVQSSVTHHVTITSSNFFQSCLFIKAIVSYENSCIMGPQQLTNVFYLLMGLEGEFLLTIILLVDFSDLNKTYFSLFKLFCQVDISLSRVVIILIIIPRARGNLYPDLMSLKDLECDISQFQNESASVLQRASITIFSFVRPRFQKFINQVPMGRVYLNPIKPCLFGQLHTFTPLFFALFNFLQGHFMWDLITTFNPAVFIPNTDGGRSPWLQSPGCVFKTCSPSMINLGINPRVLSVYCFDNLFPSFQVLIIEETSSSGESLSSLTPGHTLCKNDSCSSPLSVILLEELVGDSSLELASLTSHGSQNHSVFEGLRS